MSTHSTCKHCGVPIEKLRTASGENAWAHISSAVDSAQGRPDAGTHYYPCTPGGHVMADSADDPLPKMARYRVTTQVRQAYGHWVIHDDDVFEEKDVRPELVALVNDWDWVTFGHTLPSGVSVRRVARKVEP